MCAFSSPTARHCIYNKSSTIERQLLNAPSSAVHHLNQPITTHRSSVKKHQLLTITARVPFTNDQFSIVTPLLHNKQDGYIAELCRHHKYATPSARVTYPWSMAAVLLYLVPGSLGYIRSPTPPLPHLRMPNDEQRAPNPDPPSPQSPSPLEPPPPPTLAATSLGDEPRLLCWPSPDPPRLRNRSCRQQQRLLLLLLVLALLLFVRLLYY